MASGYAQEQTLTLRTHTNTKTKLKTTKFEKLKHYTTLLLLLNLGCSLDAVASYREAWSIAATQPRENKEVAIIGSPWSVGCTMV